MYLDKIVLFEQNWFYLGKIRSIGSKLVIFGKMVLFGLNWFYLGKLVLLAKVRCILPKWVVFNQMDFI